jgi:hypothetical protein
MKRTGEQPGGESETLDHAYQASFKQLKVGGARESN